MGGTRIEFQGFPFGGGCSSIRCRTLPPAHMPLPHLTRTDLAEPWCQHAWPCAVGCCCLLLGCRSCCQAASPEASAPHGPFNAHTHTAEFKFLGLQQAGANSTTPAMTARATAFTASLHAASRTASRLGLGRHLPSRIRLAATYAVPTANFGDMVWGTDQLHPSEAPSNPV